MTDHDLHLERIAAGDPRAFAAWVAAAEPRVRLSLSSFAARVDTEVVVQETLLRIWQVAPRFAPDGRPDGLIRLAVRIARNLAVTEVRRRRPELVDDAMLDEHAAAPVPPVDPPDGALRAAVERCLEALPTKPRQAIQARIAGAVERDRVLAENIGMKLNTFVQNVRRARLALTACLRKHGFPLGVVR
ncbi:MAG: hypothetical protein KDA22_07235 [Phycisphaerales bacterium]|nr:hypothetical protein [Phycisphaerales bacterium]